MAMCHNIYAGCHLQSKSPPVWMVKHESWHSIQPNACNAYVKVHPPASQGHPMDSDMALHVTIHRMLTTIILSDTFLTL